ncbi:MAG: hypothetical protein ACRD3W_00730, partial [Terriglobales bacterium]
WNHPYNGWNGYHGYGGWGGYGWGYSPAAAWTFAGLTSATALCGFLGMAALAGGSSQPVSYSNVTYNGGNVYVNGVPEGSSAQFYQQAQQLAGSAYTAPTEQTDPDFQISDSSTAGSATTPPSDQWKQLGVFALAEPGQTQSNMLLNLSINANGIVNGEYLNQLTNETSQVYGALDKSTQRISWTIGKNPNTVFDAGLGDLVKDDSSVLVHYGPNDTQRMALIRMKQPPPQPQGTPPAGAPVPPPETG